MRQSVPEYPDIELLKDMSAEFSRELHAAHRNADPSRSQGMGKAVSQTIDKKDMWLTEIMSKHPERWHGSLRVADALLTGIQDGSFPLGDHDEVMLLRSIALSHLDFIPFVVEHYIDTGELAALFDEIELHTPIETLLTGAAYFADSSDGLKAGVRVKMLRIYSLDSAQDREHADSAQHHRLPLDVRMHLCGIYDEVGEDEVRWDYEMRTSGGYLAGTEGEILASFEEMTARQQPEPSQ